MNIKTCTGYVYGLIVFTYEVAQLFLKVNVLSVNVKNPKRKKKWVGLIWMSSYQLYQCNMIFFLVIV